MTPEAKKRFRFVVRVGLFAGLLFGLIWVLAPSLRKDSGAKEIVSRSTCAANLKQFGQCFAMYASAFDGRLPSAAPGFRGTWLCDQPASVLDAMAAQPPQGRWKKWLVCPVNSPQQDASLWKTSGNYVVTGYVWLNDRGPGMPSLVAGAGGVPPLAYHDKWGAEAMADRTELVMDWVISDTSSPATKTWFGIKSPGRPGVYDTSHMASDTAPRGGNVLYMDGHAKFEAFTAGTAVAIQQGSGSGAPCFWVPRF